MEEKPSITANKRAMADIRREIGVLQEKLNHIMSQDDRVLLVRRLKAAEAELKQPTSQISAPPKKVLNYVPRANSKTEGADKRQSGFALTEPTSRSAGRSSESGSGRLLETDSVRGAEPGTGADNANKEAIDAPPAKLVSRRIVKAKWFGRDDDGTFGLVEMENKWGDTIYSQWIKKENIKDYIGKGLAAGLLESSRRGGFQTLTGLDRMVRVPELDKIEKVIASRGMLDPDKTVSMDDLKVQVPESLSPEEGIPVPIQPKLKGVLPQDFPEIETVHESSELQDARRRVGREILEAVEGTPAHLMPEKTPSLIPVLIVLGLLLFSFADLPYAYYILLRAATFVACIYYGFGCWRKLHVAWIWTLAVFGIVYFPLAPIRLERVDWESINLVTIVMFGILVSVLFWKSRKRSSK